ncbi:hypothetical protein [Kamptonema sp. UHCC 0994]|nr:hypothetical protein [Kamptonema sp. UHCC 0994]MDF0555901.1 hypothetical protein [Kamptonema sp. UHCC 0994]
MLLSKSKAIALNIDKLITIGVFLQRSPFIWIAKNCLDDQIGS